MTLDYATAAYAVMAVGYGLTTIPLMRQGWGGHPSKRGGKVIPLPRHRARSLEPTRQLRAS